MTQIIINADTLRKAVSKLSLAISSNPILSILGTIKFSVQEESITISSSDLESTIQSTIQCETKEPDEFCVSYVELKKLLDCVPTGALIIKRDGKIATKGIGSAGNLSSFWN